MAKKDFLYCEETDTKIRNNDVVSISTYPDVKWIAKNGWYKIGSAQKNGWYFVSISDKTILPIDLVDIKDITKDPMQPRVASTPKPAPESTEEPIDNNVDYLYIEDQDLTIRPNDIVELTLNIGGPVIKCVAKNGWYKIGDEQFNGWYFMTISDRTVIPLGAVDTNTIVKEQIVGTSELRPTLQDIDTQPPEMLYIVIPGTDIRIYDSDIVKIDTRPNLKWITHCGWFFYQGSQSYGWYFVSIKDGEILPASVIDLTLCSLATLKTQGSEIYDGRVENYTRPFTPADAEILRRAFITVDTIAQRDNIDKQKLVNGKLVRVNDAGGLVVYYAWNSTTSTWEKVDFGGGSGGGIPEIIGTPENPIVLSDVPVGLYRVLGVYKISPDETDTITTDIHHIVFTNNDGETTWIKVITEKDIQDYSVVRESITFSIIYATEQYVDDKYAILEQQISKIISEFGTMVLQVITDNYEPISKQFIDGLFV